MFPYRWQAQIAIKRCLRRKTSPFSEWQRERERETENIISTTSCFSLPIWLWRSGLLNVFSWQPEQGLGDEDSAPSEYDQWRTSHWCSQRTVWNPQQFGQCSERVYKSTHLYTEMTVLLSLYITLHMSLYITLVQWKRQLYLRGHFLVTPFYLFCVNKSLINIIKCLIMQLLIYIQM